jgi:serine/threonine protein kinase
MIRKNTRQLVTPSQVCVVNGDGSITFEGKQISVPEAYLEEFIGSGANGFVVKGYHRIIKAPLVVKFWAKLRTEDARDKMAQGIAEIKKQIAAEGYQSVLLWRGAGESQGVFYAVMDLFPGQTLECWLKDTHPLGLRRLIAYRLVDDVCGMAYSGIYHGDLHQGNLMIDARAASLLDGIEPSFAIIDFGTSRFARGGRSASQARHWRKFTETLDRLVSPFELRALAPGALHISNTANSIRDWYRARLDSIRHALIHLGAQWLIAPGETRECHIPATAVDLTRKLIEYGTLRLSEGELGPGQLWWPRHRPLDSATLDGFGPPWNTSITDQAWWKSRRGKKLDV